MPTTNGLNILVLAGGISHERDVSLRSGRRLADSLSAHAHTVTIREPDGSLLDFIHTNKPDVIWPALHGASGENGALATLLELSGVPFVGSRGDAAQLAWSKPTAKTLVAADGVKTPVALTLPRETFRELGADSVLNVIASSLSLPLVVKPARGGSAQGVSMVNGHHDLPRALVEAYTYCETVLIEEHIGGTEVSVAIVDTGEGPRALPSVEIEPRTGAYTFEARYNAGETCFFTPARLDSTTLETLARVAIASHEKLGLRHFSRMDFIVDETGCPWFLEANVIPGLTETSILPQAIIASGDDLGSVYAAVAHVAFLDHANEDVSRETSLTPDRNAADSSRQEFD